MSCYSNIIGIHENCKEDSGVIPTSGYYISDYPGITLKAAANVAEGFDENGVEYLYGLRKRAMVRMQNDVLRYINRNFKTNTLDTMPWSTCKEIRENKIIAPSSSTDKRGIVLEKKNIYCRLQKIFIEKVSIAVRNTQTTDLKIADATNNVVHTYAGITLQGGFENEFIINKSFSGNEVQIYLPGNVEVLSLDPECNCGGESSNECIRILGMNNTILSKSEGYGITAYVRCKCDFTDLLCDLSCDRILGQAAYELIGGMFYEERLKTSRFNWMTIYDEESIAKQAEAAFQAYNSNFFDAMEGLKPIIQSADKCGCVDCSGYQLKDNI